MKVNAWVTSTFFEAYVGRLWVRIAVPSLWSRMKLSEIISFGIETKEKT